MMLDIDKIEIALKSLNETLEHDKAPNTELVVCGGAALNVMGLVKRTTRDIDVIGILEMNGEIVRLAMLREFPIYLLQAIKDVKNTLGLPEDWINLGPEKTLDYAFLPTGIETRLKRIVYGEKLTIFYLSRIDQIYFKLLAASAMEVSHHLDDLKVLNPTVGELGEAVKWVLTQSITDEKKMNLKIILEQLSYV